MVNDKALVDQQNLAVEESTAKATALSVLNNESKIENIQENPPITDKLVTVGESRPREAIDPPSTTSASNDEESDLREPDEEGVELEEIFDGGLFEGELVEGELVEDELVEDELDEDESEEGADIDLDDKLVQFLEVLQSSIDSDIKIAPDNSEYVHAPPELSQAVVNDLISKGPMMFIAKYLVPNERPVPVPVLYAALGFSLPKAIFETPEFTPKHLEIGLQIAIRYVMKTRPRLPHPRTLDEVVDVIQRSQKILVVTGAGISTSLGIPDFRSDNGIYAQLEHLGLADPQEVFDIRLFKEDPSIFYSVAAKILPEKGLYSGTPTHEFIRMLDAQGKLLRNYTQNIDNIEHFVGISPENLVHCHGSFGSAHCFTCGYREPNGENLFPAIRQGEIPKCPQCTGRQSMGKRRKRQLVSSKRNTNDDSDEDETDEPSFGVMKPDITFFGESLPPRFDNLLFDEGDKDVCDLVICLGTSLRVSPVSEIVKVVGRQVPQIYISKTPAKHLNFEASFLGGCDDTVELLAQKLGWKLTHPMTKRAPGMLPTEFPGGKIEYDDGVFRFVDDSTVNSNHLIAESVGAESDTVGKDGLIASPTSISSY